jgi:hypothetical protein
MAVPRSVGRLFVLLGIMCVHGARGMLEDLHPADLLLKTTHGRSWVFYHIDEDETTTIACSKEGARHRLGHTYWVEGAANVFSDPMCNFMFGVHAALPDGTMHPEPVSTLHAFQHFHRSKWNLLEVDLFICIVQDSEIASHQDCKLFVNFGTNTAFDGTNFMHLDPYFWAVHAQWLMPTFYLKKEYTK